MTADISDACERARLLLEAGRPGDAEKLLGEALARDPAGSDAQLLLTVSLVQQNRLPEAVRAAERACVVAPERAEAHVLRSRALARFGRYWDASDAGSVAIRLDPGSWDAYAARAESLAHAAARRPRAHVSLDRARHRGLREAILLAQRAVELAPFEPGAWFSLGIATGCAGKRRRSKAAYRRVLQLDPADAGAVNNLALLAMGRGRLAASTDLLLAGGRARPAGGLWLDNLDAVLSRALLRAAFVMFLAFVAGVVVGGLMSRPGWAYVAMLGCFGYSLWRVLSVLQRYPRAARAIRVRRYVASQGGRAVLVCVALSLGSAALMALLLATLRSSPDWWHIFLVLARVTIFMLGTGGWLVSRGKND